LDDVDRAIRAVRAGEPVLLPTDTVYGLCANPFRREDVERMYRLKGRAATQPTAILFGSVESVVEHLPELHSQEYVLRALLPGPLTLIVPNPSGRFQWLAGERADTIGIRVPQLAAAVAAILARVGGVAATSANDPGRRDPRTIEDVPERIRTGCGAVVDAGELPGTPSTVVDLTGSDAQVLREGALPAADALERVRAAVGRRE
jgi:L-threonylcarbamoyladenylate synthase